MYCQFVIHPSSSISLNLQHLRTFCCWLSIVYIFFKKVFLFAFGGNLMTKGQCPDPKLLDKPHGLSKQTNKALVFHTSRAWCSILWYCEISGIISHIYLPTKPSKCSEDLLLYVDIGNSTSTSGMLRHRRPDSVKQIQWWITVTDIHIVLVESSHLCHMKT